MGGGARPVRLLGGRLVVSARLGGWRREEEGRRAKVREKKSMGVGLSGRA